jgi:hypothetical protein
MANFAAAGLDGPVRIVKRKLKKMRPSGRNTGCRRAQEKVALGPN